MARNFIFPTVILLFTLLLSGCGGGAKNVEVQGKVTLKGQAFQNIRGGSVTFIPVNGGKPIYGEIQPDGSFRMKTDAKWGAPVGEYNVAVTVYSHEYVGDNTYGQAPPKLLSPTKFADAATSGLTQTVPAAGLTDLAIDLK